MSIPRQYQYRPRPIPVHPQPMPKSQTHRRMKQPPPIPYRNASHRPSGFAKPAYQSSTNAYQRTVNARSDHADQTRMGFDPTQNSLASHGSPRGHHRNTVYHRMPKRGRYPNPSQHLFQLQLHQPHRMNVGARQKNRQSRDPHAHSPSFAHLERRYAPRVLSLPLWKFHPASLHANGFSQPQSHGMIHGWQPRPYPQTHSSARMGQTVKSYTRFSMSPHPKWQPHRVAGRRGVFGAWIFGSQTSFASDHSIQFRRLYG